MQDGDKSFDYGIHQSRRGLRWLAYVVDAVGRARKWNSTSTVGDGRLPAFATS